MAMRIRLQRKHFSGPARPWLALCLAASCLAGCRIEPWQGFPSGIHAEHVWPPLPESPRITFVQEIRTHRDLYSISGRWGAIGRFLAGPPDSNLVRPFALALHPAGGLLVSDPGRRVVHFYCWSRRKYAAIGPERPGGLESPVGVAALPDGRILVADSRLGSIETFGENGDYLGPFAAPGVLGRPAGIAADAARRQVYVADVTNHMIAVFDESGGRIRSIGGRGAVPGEFNFPTHLSLDAQGRLVVSDSMNFRVQVLEPDGTPVSVIGSLGDAPGQFSNPKGAVADSHGRIIAVEGRYDALEVFDERGALLLHIGEPGAGPGQFWLPAGLCIDRRQGLLFVADSYNSRIQVFRLLDAPNASNEPAAGSSVSRN